MSRQDEERRWRPDWSKTLQRKVHRTNRVREIKTKKTDGVSDQGVRFIFIVAAVTAVSGGLYSLLKLLLK